MSHNLDLMKIHQLITKLNGYLWLYAHAHIPSDTHIARSFSVSRGEGSH